MVSGSVVGTGRNNNSRSSSGTVSRQFRSQMVSGDFLLVDPVFLIVRLFDSLLSIPLSLRKLVSITAP
jgi:hypothetical protein